MIPLKPKRSRGSNGQAQKPASSGFCPSSADPHTTIAGWLKLSFWQCFMWGALGKLLRFVVMTGGALWIWPGLFLPG